MSSSFFTISLQCLKVTLKCLILIFVLFVYLRFGAKIERFEIWNIFEFSRPKINNVIPYLQICRFLAQKFKYVSNRNLWISGGKIQIIIWIWKWTLLTSLELLWKMRLFWVFLKHCESWSTWHRTRNLHGYSCHPFFIF